MKEKWIREIKKHFRGHILDDSLSRYAYSTDASILQQIPRLVACPLDEQDLHVLCQIALEYHIPLTPRGGATGIAGACLGEGIVIDFTRSMRKILHIHTQSSKPSVLCQAGVIQDQLNQALKPYGYRLGPNTSTSQRASLGGMLACNAAGSHSLLYGTMADHLISCTFFDGLGKKRTLKAHEHDPFLLHSLDQLAKKHRTLLSQVYQRPRQSSGYLLWPLKQQENYPSLLCSSEGTLGICYEMELKICKSPSYSQLLLLAFEDIFTALQSVPELLELHPMGLEIIDDKTCAQLSLLPFTKTLFSQLGDGEIPKAILACEFYSYSEQKQVDRSIEQALDMLNYQSYSLCDRNQAAKFWDDRKQALALLMSRKSSKKAVAFIEDIALPPHKQSCFIRKLDAVLRNYGVEYGLYGHAGAGCLHIRPFLDLSQQRDKATLWELFEKAIKLTKEHEGLLSGEHGDGMIRAWANERIFDPAYIACMKELKQLFDPYNILNPGKVLSKDKPFKQLKPAIKKDPNPLIQQSHECNGNGICRQIDGLMCPSFQSSFDELQSPRGRAHILQEYFRSSFIKKCLLDSTVEKSLESCVGCKACQTHCPSSIDIASLKSLWLSQRQFSHFSIKTQAMASLPSILQFLHRIPPAWQKALVKGFNQAQKSLLKSPQSPLWKLLGLSSDIHLPLVNFLEYKITEQKPKSLGIFVDTYMRSFEPEIFHHARALLHKLDYPHNIYQEGCCGRIAFSMGKWRLAKKQLKRLISSLPLEQSDFELLVLEPSCYSMLAFDSQYLLDFSEYRALKSKVRFMETWLYEKYPQFFSAFSSRDFFWRHCHDRALNPSTHENSCKKAHSGCCAMAGSFGLWKKNQGRKQEIYNLNLIPLLQEKDWNSLIANGFSCRHQITALTQKKVITPIEFLNMHIKEAHHDR